MGKLIYSAIMSLDGYIEDQDGRFDWAEPDEQVHQFVNDLERAVATYLLGRRMYETMAVWETDPSFAAGPPVYRDFALIWQAADKIVYSRTLPAISTLRTRLERDFDPEAVRKLKETTSQDLSIGGPGLASHAFEAGLVDECYLFLTPVVLGGGKRALPVDVQTGLELLDERRFDNGMLYLRYKLKPR